MTASTEFDRKAAAWVRKHYRQPLCDVITGSIEFEINVSRPYWDDRMHSDLDVTWRETVHYPLDNGTELPGGERSRSATIDPDLYSLTDVMRELVEMEDPGE